MSVITVKLHLNLLFSSFAAANDWNSFPKSIRQLSTYIISSQIYKHRRGDDVESRVCSFRPALLRKRDFNRAEGGDEVEKWEVRTGGPSLEQTKKSPP